MTQFVRATVADVDAVTALTRAAYGPWVALIGREPLPMVVDQAEAIRHHLVDLWHDDGVLVALIEMVPLVDHLLIENVAVMPGQQGKGLGHRLMDHAEATARRLNLPEIRLYTNAAFAANLAFYQALGYVETRRAAFRGGHMVYFSKRSGA
ncbi:MAG: GNAT family N-acetyltransferase [bacterium]